MAASPKAAVPRAVAFFLVRGEVHAGTLCVNGAGLARDHKATQGLRWAFAGAA